VDLTQEDGYTYRIADITVLGLECSNDVIFWCWDITLNKEGQSRPDVQRVPSRHVWSARVTGDVLAVTRVS
jgi:hypothetical protein